MSRRNQGFTRRDWIQTSLASTLGMSASGWFPQLAGAAKQSQTPASCILLWMAGGPSQLDTFDPKPQHDHGGPVAAIPTTATGVHVSEHLPGIAQHMHNLSIIRNMNSGEGDHGRGSQLMLTGYKPNPALVYPSLGSLVSKELGSSDHDLPNYVSLSSARQDVQFRGSGFLGPRYAPLLVSGASDDPTVRANLSIEHLALPQGVNQDTMNRRFDMLGLLQAEFGKRFDDPAARAHRANSERAARMVESQARNAFQLDEEPAALRDAYGRNRFGQGCLLARRLVERGVPFVEVTLSGLENSGILGWDTHGNNFAQVRDLCGVLDPAWSTLMHDLQTRDLLSSTLVLWMGEFGRTPVINDNNGRDHWASGWSVVLGGARIRGGGVIGDTGNDGLKLREDPSTGTNVPDLYATICAALDIDPHKENTTDANRPIAVVDEGGTPIQDLLA